MLDLPALNRPPDSMRKPLPTSRQRQLSRRRFLIGSGALAAATLAACGGGSGGAGPTIGRFDGSPSPQAGDDGAPTPTPGATSTRIEGDPGLTMTGFVFSDAVFDPHKTQVGTLHGQQSFVYSRLLTFQDQGKYQIGPDLATALPEQPDATTYVFKLNENARWHEVEPVNGRQLTAEDVKYSFDRQINGPPAEFHRAARWQNIESIEVTSPAELVIKTKAPFAPLLSHISDVNAFIVAREQDESAPFAANLQIGSGPFTWVEWDENNFASVARNPSWHGGEVRLGGVSVRQPRDTTEIEASLRVRDLDATFVGRRQADQLLANVPDLQEQLVGNALFFGMRFSTEIGPYNDSRVRSALAHAIDRQDLIQKLFQGSGDTNPWVSWPMERWALPKRELTALPGYRIGSGARAQDIADARALLESARSDGIRIPSPLRLGVEITSEQQLSLGSLIARYVGEALGIEVVLDQLEVGDLVSRHFERDAPWIAGPDNGWLDLDEWVYQYFHSDGVQNSFGLRNSDLDAMLERQRAEFDPDARQSIGWELQRQLLSLNPGVNFVSERIVSLRWPYVRDFALDVTDGYQARFARTWVDTEDKTYRSR